MRFASVAQIVVMAVLTCAGLFALDYWKNPQLWRTTPVSAAEEPVKEVRLILWMNHMVCTSCLDDVRQALSGTASLDFANARVTKPLMTKEQADAAPVMADYGNGIEVRVADLDKLDFVAVDRALREKGFVAARMELGGVEHFRLEAKLNHICCGACEKATIQQIDFLKAAGARGQLRWLDSLDVDRDNKTVTAYARYLEPGKTVDVNEFIAGLGETGFAPLSVRAMIGDEQAKPHDAQAETHADTHDTHLHAAEAH